MKKAKKFLQNNTKMLLNVQVLVQLRNTQNWILPGIRLQRFTQMPTPSQTCWITMKTHATSQRTVQVDGSSSACLNHTSLQFMCRTDLTAVASTSKNHPCFIDESSMFYRSTSNFSSLRYYLRSQDDSG